MGSRDTIRMVAAALIAVSSLAGRGEAQAPATPLEPLAPAPEAGRSPYRVHEPRFAGHPVPLAHAWHAMTPRAVWQHFYDLTQVPRPSHHEQEVTDLVAEFGRSLGLETVVDAAGNVIIRKPATPGREGRAGVVLQAHLDMVAQPTDGSHDFLTEPIDAFVQDGWVFADGTTLGADDGIGVALILALLEAEDVVHGPLEALFTTNEEDGQTGIGALATDALYGRLYVNVDNELEGQFVISSAGAVSVDAQATYGEEATPPGLQGYEIAVDGLTGGHSGNDIDEGRASAHELVSRLLVLAPAELGVRVASVIGCDTLNAIPTRATAVVAVPASQAAAFGAFVEEFAASAASEYAATDPGISVTTASVAVPPEVMDAAAQQALIGAVHDAPQGVWKWMSDTLVETSGNVGALAVADGHFSVGVKVRSALDDERDAHAQRYVALFEQAFLDANATGATIELWGAYSSWPPDPDSPLLALMERVYADTFGASPEVAAIHAGLETSVAGEKFPGMDMISIGPTIQGLHSIDERLLAASVPRVYDLLAATLAAIE